MNGLRFWFSTYTNKQTNNMKSNKKQVFSFLVRECCTLNLPLLVPIDWQRRWCCDKLGQWSAGKLVEHRVVRRLDESRRMRCACMDCGVTRNVRLRIGNTWRWGENSIGRRKSRESKWAWERFHSMQWIEVDWFERPSLGCTAVEVLETASEFATRMNMNARTHTWQSERER